MMRKITIIAVSCLFVLLLSACFSPYAGDTGTITINVGGSAGRVNMWNGLDTDNFTHIITLTNGPGPDQSRTIGPGVARASFIVAPGMWTITVKGILDGKVVSVGSERKDITAGTNGAIIITMGEATLDDTFNVTDLVSWNAAVAAIRSGGSYRSYLINITTGTSVPIPGVSAATFGSVSGIDVTISGGGTLQLDATNGSLIYIGAGQSFTLQNVNLQGRGTGGTDNNASLVRVDGAKFFMEDGEISGNTNNSTIVGGGVFISGNGTFTMSGGKIFGNNVNSHGGGVAISGSTFTMSGGEIYSNTSTATGRHGGGMYITGNATFTMTGGSIYDNEATNGGGVSFTGGTFTMTGGKIYNNKASLYGVGIAVTGGGTFTMSGGEIYNNTTTATSTESYGGGVYITGTCTFNMTDGSIYGNEAIYGGGVQVTSGSFRLITGIIVGNTDYTYPAGGKNYAANIGTGAALYLTGGTAQFGDGIGTWQNILPHTDSNATRTDNTIHVINGVKQ